jgi:rfaE bifunctional protein nucleotidyltransferase chain/domain
VIIGFTNGCYDGLHPGHDHFLRQARALCDWLIVAVNSDESIRRLKGAQRPINPLMQRLLDLDRTYCPAAIIPFEGDPIPLLRQIRPHVLIRGWDQSDEGREYAQDFVRIPRLQGYSTTELYFRPVMTVDHQGSKRKFVVLEDYRTPKERNLNASD